MRVRDSGGSVCGVRVSMRIGDKLFDCVEIELSAESLVLKKELGFGVCPDAR